MFDTLGPKKTVRLLIGNSVWLVGGRIGSIVLAFIASVALARYLGPEKYGLYNYAISFVALAAALSGGGLSGLVVHALSGSKHRDGQIMGTALFIKTGTSILAVFLIGVLGYFAHYAQGEPAIFLLIAIASLRLLAQPAEIFHLWFESKLRAKYIISAQLAGAILSTCLILLFVFWNRSLPLLLLAASLSPIITVITSALIYKKIAAPKLSSPARHLVRHFLSRSWILILSGIGATFYLKIDQVMLKHLSSSHELGIYAVAASMSESWFFIPAAFITSVFPFLSNLRSDPAKYEERFRAAYGVIIGTSATAALVVGAIAMIAIPVIYGAQYAPARYILLIHIWGGIFYALRMLAGRWLIIEDLLRFSLLSHGLGAISNIVINWFLIPTYGGYGAAVATVISYAVAGPISFSLFSSTRPAALQMVRGALHIPQHIREMTLLLGKSEKNK